MRSAENRYGRAPKDAPAVHWKPLTASSRGGITCRDESLDATLQNQSAMKPKFLNCILALVFHRREAIANDAREASIANAFSEAEPMEESADGWFKVSPYGISRGKTPGRPQHFTEDVAKRMVAGFNSLRCKLCRILVRSASMQDLQVMEGRRIKGRTECAASWPSTVKPVPA